MLSRVLEALGEEPEHEDYGSLETFFFPRHWVELQVEFGRVVSVNCGVVYDETDEPLWPTAEPGLQETAAAMLVSRGSPAHSAAAAPAFSCSGAEGVPVSSFQLLSASDRPFYPADGRCPLCGAEFSQGVAYLSAGALHLTANGQDSLHSDRFLAFLRVGFHGRDPEMQDSSDVSVVADLHGRQFDLQWCSVRCMREWLLVLLREVESLAAKSN